MRYEVSKDEKVDGSWCVAAIGQNGITYTAFFTEPNAELRAKQFAVSRNARLHLRAA